MTDKLQAGEVCPLKIIEKNRQRVAALCKGADEPAKGCIEAGLGFRHWKWHDRKLRTQNQLNLGDELGHNATVRTERIVQSPFPLFELRLAPAQDLLHEPPQGVNDCRIRDIPLMLLELAGNEKTMLAGNG